MAADFGFVVDSAERKAREFAAESAGDGFAERSFADSWGPDETENRTLHAGL